MVTRSDDCHPIGRKNLIGTDWVTITRFM